MHVYLRTEHDSAALAKSTMAQLRERLSKLKLPPGWTSNYSERSILVMSPNRKKVVKCTADNIVFFDRILSPGKVRSRKTQCTSAEHTAEVFISHLG